MNCYYHEERAAVAQCTKCGKGLCKECVDKYTPILCDDCYDLILRRNEELKRQEKANALREEREYHENYVANFKKAHRKGLLKAAFWVLLGLVLLLTADNTFKSSKDFIEGTLTFVKTIVPLSLLRYSSCFNGWSAWDVVSRDELNLAMYLDNMGVFVGKVFGATVVNTLTGPFSYFKARKSYKNSLEYLKNC